ncbi:MAG: hypothetical protein IJU50_04795, partial [Lachnospiraceae bacterium]|nr:hypothetical protein [Lachnospiraceae bacterium]
MGAGAAFGTCFPVRKRLAYCPERGEGNISVKLTVDEKTDTAELKVKVSEKSDDNPEIEGVTITATRPAGVGEHIVSAKYFTAAENLDVDYNQASIFTDAQTIDLRANDSVSLKAKKGDYVYLMVEMDDFLSLSGNHTGSKNVAHSIHYDEKNQRRSMYFKGLSDNLEGTGIALGGILLNQHYHASIGVGESFSLEAVYCPPLGQESGEVIYEIESYRNNLYIKDFTESRNSTGKFTVSGKKISGSSREIISVTVFDKALLEQYGGGGNAALAYTHFDVQVTDGSSSSDKTDISSAIGYAPSAYAGKQSAVSVTLDGKTLKAGTDYALSCDSSAVNINGGKVSASAEGTYVLKAAGAGKYEGSVEFFFTVLPASEKMVDLKKQGVITNLPKSVPYSGASYDTLEAIGAAAGAEVYVVLKDGTRLEAGDYAVSVTKGLDKGTATIQVSGQGRYTGTLKKTFKIAAFDLAANPGGAVSISMAEEAEFSKGGAIPAVSVSFNGTPLVAGTDYTLKISNNKAVAGASAKKAPTVTITGKGNFTKKMT